VAFVPEKGWFWFIPLHNDVVSVGVVAEGKYLTRGGVKDPGKIFQREISQNHWIKEYLSSEPAPNSHHLLVSCTIIKANLLICHFRPPDDTLRAILHTKDCAGESLGCDLVSPSGRLC